MDRVHHLDPHDRAAALARIAAVLRERPEVMFATVFGSFLTQASFHDVDVGLWTAESASPRLDLDLGLALSREIGLPVDVRRLNDAPISFLFQALRGRTVAVRDERLLADLMERTARTYHDRAPILRLATREAFAG